jgi:hypothetical protein
MSLLQESVVSMQRKENKQRGKLKVDESFG